MRWEAKHDRDAFKEVWLLFDNEQGRFPLYPCDSVWIEYAYTVSDTKWGRWFQRAVRLPTEHLEVVLAFPAALDPVVWGTETSMTAEASPLPSAPGRRQQGLTEARLLLPSRRWRMKFRGRLLIRRAKLIASKGCSSARPEQRTPNPRVAGSNPVTPAGLAMPLPSPHSPLAVGRGPPGRLRHDRKIHRLAGPRAGPHRPDRRPGVGLRPADPTLTSRSWNDHLAEQAPRNSWECQPRPEP